MFRFGLSFVFSSIVLGAFSVTVAHANPEPVANYDARVAGMAGIAIPTVDNAAAVFQNPAQLDEVDRLSLTIAVSALFVNFQAPFAGPGTEQDSGLIFAPLGLLGGAARVSKRVTLGLGVYIPTGFGGGYDDVSCISNGAPELCDDPDHEGRFSPPESQSVTLFILEVAAALSVRITDKLVLGLSLRLPWGSQSVSVNQEIVASLYARADQSVSGFGHPGILFGMTYRPTEELTLAATYRSKVRVSMSGETSTPNPFNPDVSLILPTETNWYVPHMARIGFAYTFAKRFTLAGEFKVQFHQEANSRQTFVLDGADNTVAEFQWKNVFAGALAGEYLVTPKFPVRLGVSMANSASNEISLTPFSPPPGIAFGVYGGLGLRLKNLNIDLGVAWGGGPAATVEQNGQLCASFRDRTVEENGESVLKAAGGCAGEYDVDSVTVALSLTYRR